MNKAYYFFLSLVVIFFACVSTAPVQAADPKPTIRDAQAYQAKYVSQSVADPIVIEAGESKVVDITFKNTGTATWNTSGSRYISAYTMEPRERVSVFLNAKQTKPILKPAKPGENAVLRLTLTAPEKVGEYTEEFYLAAENYSWLQGGYFFLKIVVVPKKTLTVQHTTTTPVAASGTPASAADAKLMGQSIKTVTTKGGEPVSLKVLFQHTGKEAWKGYNLIAKEGSGAVIADDSWKDARTIVDRSSTAVAAGSIVKETITFRAPSKVGSYEAQFFLEGKEQSAAIVMIQVTEDAKSDTLPFAPVDSEVSEETPRVAEEPRIRVGLVGEGTTVQFVSYDDEYAVLVDGLSEGTLPKRKVAIVIYDNGIYRVRGAGLDINTSGVVRFEPMNNPHAIIEVMNGLKDRSIGWVGPSRFIRYHGAVEYRRGVKDGEMYVVNDLLLEDYVKGIAETGKEVHEEAVKANIIAARTYAYLSKGKYAFFDVLGSTYDQLYLGADVAQFLTKVPLATQATRGQMVTYNDEIVTTPYFGNSNGKTKSWSSVWGGANKPWLVPVSAAYDAGRKQFGHGVGMSQRDAALKAAKDAWDYKQILGHYYTNTDVTLIYR